MKKADAVATPPIMKGISGLMGPIKSNLISRRVKEEMKMRVKKVLKNLFLVFFAVIVGSGSAYAIPTLQLDIQGGRYDTTDETIYATQNSFNLYALLNPDNASVTDKYYISAALSPKTGMPGGDFGSFTFGGETVAVTGDITGDMSYGISPLGLLSGKDLPKHDIFETYFTEFSFNFDPNNKTQEYNSQEFTGQGPMLDANGNMYFKSFLVDTSLLSAGYSIHFDLYNKTATGGINQFAPFSHDASSKPTGTTSVPEPATLLLLGVGLVGLAGVRKKYRA